MTRETNSWVRRGPIGEVATLDANVLTLTPAISGFHKQFPLLNVPLRTDIVRMLGLMLRHDIRYKRYTERQ